MSNNLNDILSIENIIHSTNSNLTKSINYYKSNNINININILNNDNINKDTISNNADYMSFHDDVNKNTIIRKSSIVKAQPIVNIRSPSKIDSSSGSISKSYNNSSNSSIFSNISKRKPNLKVHTQNLLNQANTISITTSTSTTTSNTNTTNNNNNYTGSISSPVYSHINLNKIYSKSLDSSSITTNSNSNSNSNYSSNSTVSLKHSSTSFLSKDKPIHVNNNLDNHNLKEKDIHNDNNDNDDMINCMEISDDSLSQTESINSTRSIISSTSSLSLIDGQNEKHLLNDNDNDNNNDNNIILLTPPSSQDLINEIIQNDNSSNYTTNEINKKLPLPPSLNRSPQSLRNNYNYNYNDNNRALSSASSISSTASNLYSGLNKQQLQQQQQQNINQLVIPPNAYPSPGENSPSNISSYPFPSPSGLSNNKLPPTISSSPTTSLTSSNQNDKIKNNLIINNSNDNQICNNNNNNNSNNDNYIKKRINFQQYNIEKKTITTSTNSNNEIQNRYIRQDKINLDIQSKLQNVNNNNNNQHQYKYKQQQEDDQKLSYYQQQQQILIQQKQALHQQQSKPVNRHIQHQQQSNNNNSHHHHHNHHQYHHHNINSQQSNINVNNNENQYYNPQNKSKLTVAEKYLSKHKLNSKFCELYKLGEQLGSGGFGFVCEAIALYNNRNVAVKFILRSKVPPNDWIRDKDLGIIPLEIFMLKNLKHKNIIEFLDYFEDSTFFYVVTELHGALWESKKNNKNKKNNDVNVTNTNNNNDNNLNELKSCSSSFDITDNNSNKNQKSLFNEKVSEKSKCRVSMDLFECIEQHQRLTEKQAHKIFIQIVDALSYLQSLGIVHRDIKDENILIDADFNVKLIDFGSAAFIPQNKFDRFLGTIQYAAPEILRGETYKGPEAEIWALGCCLYIMLNGEVPFSSPQQASIASYTIPKYPCSLVVIDLLDGLLSKRPEKRLNLNQIRNHPWILGHSKLS